MEPVYIALVVAVVIIGILLLWPAFSCEKYRPNNSAKFTVSRPKHIIPSNLAQRIPTSPQRLPQRLPQKISPPNPSAYKPMPAKISTPAKPMPKPMPAPAKPMPKPMQAKPMPKPMAKAGPVAPMRNNKVKEGFIITEAMLTPNNDLSELSRASSDGNFLVGHFPGELQEGVSIPTPSANRATAQLNYSKGQLDSFWKTVI